jgi:hypothetical protein
MFTRAGENGFAWVRYTGWMGTGARDGWEVTGGAWTCQGAVRGRKLARMRKGKRERGMKQRPVPTLCERQNRKGMGHPRSCLPA